MKVKELKGLIREVVKKTLLEASYDQYGEGFYSMESAGGSSVEDKMEQAVDIAVDAAETLSRMDRYDHMEVDLATDKAVSKIVRLFLDPNGDFSDENADPNEMAQDMHDMLSMRVDRSEENLAVFDHADKLILKALNKLRMMEESVLAEALYEKHVGFKNLVKKLQGQGKSEKSAKAIAYSIGKKKYGKEKMAKAAASGKQLSDKDALDEMYQDFADSENDRERSQQFHKEFLPDFGAYLLMLADKRGYRAVAERLEQTAGMYGFEHPGEMADAVEEAVIEAFKERGDNYDPAQRLTGGNGDDIDAVQAVLDDFRAELRRWEKADREERSGLREALPEGRHGTVRAMKTHGHTGKGGIGNPYALAHYMANKGAEPHYKEQPSSKRGTPEKKKGQ